MVEKEGNKVYVKGRWIDFNRDKINVLFNLKVQKDGSKFKRLLKSQSGPTDSRKRKIEGDKENPL